MERCSCSCHSAQKVSSRWTFHSASSYVHRQLSSSRHHQSLAILPRQTQRARCGRARASVTAAVSTSEAPPKPLRGEARSHQTEVVVIGSGVGGLSCAAMLARYGVKVTVCESHTIAGGAAHSWVRDGYHFESGPSLYSGMASTGRGANPLAHVLQAIDEPLELIEYNEWNLILPEGEFLTEIGNEQFCNVVGEISGAEGVREWRELQAMMRPLGAAATMLPPTAFRFDPGVAITVLWRYLPIMLRGGTDALKLMGPFSKIIDGKVNDPFVRNYLDLLCFLLSGLPANGTIAAEVAFMFNEWYKPGCCLEFPRGGSQAMVDALIRGVEKHGGRVMLGAHVEEVVMESGRAVGVRLRGGGQVCASKAVVSNASMWDTIGLLPAGMAPAQYQRQVQETPMNRSFMHLHLGFDATGLEDLGLHHIIVNSWEGGVDTEQNVVLVSIPSVIDPGLAPPGKHTLHAYLPATEPFSIWQGLKRGGPEYKKLKEERSQVLWQGVEKIIPDIRQRVEIEMVGTPLTHRHFLRRHAGTYGPGIMAGQGSFPGPKTPIPGLMCCGDSTFPGIGLPAVAASGAVAANTLVSVKEHMKLLDAIGA